MAVYKRFEDLPVWQEAARLYNLALDLLQAHNVRLGPGWRLQFERATLSVSSNIAEGFELSAAQSNPNDLRPSANLSFVICHLSFLTAPVRRQIQRAEQLPILIRPWICRGQELVPVKDRVCPCKKAKRLCFSR
jgi:hypothetical protein